MVMYMEGRNALMKKEYGYTLYKGGDIKEIFLKKRENGCRNSVESACLVDPVGFTQLPWSSLL